MSRMLDKQKAEQRKEILIGSAFSVWLQGAGKDKTFDQYLQYYGLVEKEIPVSKEAKKAAVVKAKSIAERIMAMDKKRKKK
jgi:hypothetical protein